MSTNVYNLEPKGLWRAPLSKEQVELAKSFGVQNHRAFEGRSKPYDFSVDALPALVTSDYAAIQDSMGQPVDKSLVDDINNTPLLRTRYVLRLSRTTVWLAFVDVDSMGLQLHT